MLAGNAKRIFCDNVTCFGTNESCWNRSHLPEFFIKAPHFLLAWLLCFFTQTPRFYIFLAGDLCNTHDCPGQNNSYFGVENQGWKMSFVFLVWHPPGFFSFSDMVWRLPLLGKHQELCWASKATHFEIFQSQFGNPRMSPFEFLADRRNKTLECWLATLNLSSAIMSHSLISFQAARIGVICQSSSSKLSTSCLHGYSASLHKLHGSTFFWEAIFVIPTIVLAGTIHTLAWKIRVKKCHLSFWYGILPGSFPFQTWCADFHFPESIKNSLKQAKQLTWHQCKATHLTSIRPKPQEARETLKKTKSLCVVCGVLAMFRNRKWLLGDLPISVRKSTNIAFCKKLEKYWRRQSHFVWCVVFLQCSEIESGCLETLSSEIHGYRPLSSH